MPTHRGAALVTLVSAVLALGVPGADAQARAASSEFYVSPAGNDHADGTAWHPVRTLERARDLARARVAHLGADHRLPRTAAAQDRWPVGP